MTIIKDRLDAMARIALILDEFENQDDIDAIIQSVEALTQEAECDDDGDDDGGGTPLEKPCLKAVNE